MTETKTSTRVTVQDGWAVRDLPNGDQVRAQLRVDTFGDTDEPERDGTGVLLVCERDGYGGVDLDEHDGLREVLDRTYSPSYVHDHYTATYVIRRESEMVNGEEVDFTDCAWLEDGRLPIPREEFVRRYLRAFHGVEDAFLWKHRGNVQGDWADIWVIVEEVPLDYSDGPAPYAMSRQGAVNIAQEWSDWANGECFGVESEYRTLQDALEYGESAWEIADDSWGYIGDDRAREGLAEALDVDPSDVPKRITTEVTVH